MEIGKLQGFILLLVFIGMLLGVGVLTLDKYSRAVRTTTTIQDDAVNLTSAATLSQTYCLSVTSMTYANGTDAGISTLTWNDLDDCIIASTITDKTQKFNVTYTYGASTVTQTATDNVVTATTPIASTWLPLIVTVAILAIILGLVMSSFSGKQR